MNHPVGPADAVDRRRSSRAVKFRLRTVLEMIKIEHTLFALPFAFLGMLLAAARHPAVADGGVDRGRDGGGA